MERFIKVLIILSHYFSFKIKLGIFPMNYNELLENKKKQANKTQLKKRLIVSAIILTFIAIVVWGLVKNQQQKKPPVILQGQIEIQQSAIASKVPGRVTEILVKEGDKVKKDQQLIHMDSPEINAKIQQAKAGKAMAENQLKKAKNGARPQQIARAKAGWEANKAGTELAKATYNRIEHLYKEGLIARQKRDEIYTKYITQKLKTDASYEQYQMALEGARSEDIDTAQAQVEQIDGKLQEALIAQKEANLQSPIDGVVDNVMVNPAEVVGRGVPLLTLVEPFNQWVVLNVTENHLANFAVGNEFSAEIPALSTKDKKFTQKFTVYASSALSDFATWRATKQADSFDVRTFEIKARPQYPNPKVRAGMSVVVTLPSDEEE